MQPFIWNRFLVCGIVFLAGKEDEKNYPVHNPGFDIEESSMEDALEFLYEMVTGEFA